MPPRALDDTAWIAARQALSLAHREMLDCLLSTPYDRLPEGLRTLRQRYDRAQDYVRELQHLRDRDRAGRTRTQ